MIWWFLILAFSAGAVFWAGVSAYLRVKGHIAGSTTTDSASDTAHKDKE